MVFYDNKWLLIIACYGNSRLLHTTKIIYEKNGDKVRQKKMVSISFSMRTTWLYLTSTIYREKNIQIWNALKF